MSLTDLSYEQQNFRIWKPLRYIGTENGESRKEFPVPGNKDLLHNNLIKLFNKGK